MSEIIKTKEIKERIYTLRGKQVMLDSHLAEIYKVETRVLNQAVKRNIERFPEDFMFQISKCELNEDLKSQIVISSSEHGGRRKLPYVFTEQGVSMLSAILKSKVAIEVSITIIRAFSEMKKLIENNVNIFYRLNNIEQKQIASDVKQIDIDNKIDIILKALEDKSSLPIQGVFFNGQVYDAYTFVSDLIRRAKSSLILIDNYIDDTVLTHFTKRQTGVEFIIYTQYISKQLKLDIEKHNVQYPPVKIVKFDKAHDRFLIIDKNEIYHFGASLKDLGKKWFAFSKMHIDPAVILHEISR
jgi:hypothetical protein